MKEREIKFRAWDKKYNRMYFGDIKMALAYPVEDVAITQFTGLKDKNGKEIYEGDIVQNGSPNIKIWQDSKDGGAIMKICPIGKVIYNAPSFDITTIRNGMYENVDGKQYALYGDWQDGWANGSIEQDLTVIGNIYENPELIK